MNRTIATEEVDTIVIGGGQTGLTFGHHLAQAGRSFLILEAGDRVGDAWRNRWDSLLLFTPARMNGLPGMPFPAKGDAFISKDDMADYLEEYAGRFDHQLRLRTPVERVSRDGNGFEVFAGGELYRCANVVVATSGFGEPRIPAFAPELDPGTFQMHSRDFRRPDQLPDGPVLVVGLGNSGADIAIDLSASHDVIVAGNPPGAIPFHIEPWVARNVLIRLTFVMLTHVVTLGTPMGRKVCAATGGASPLVRVKPKDIDRAASLHVPRIVGVDAGRPVAEDGRVLDVASVLWCTGFRSSFPWLDLPVFGDGGEPRHTRGIVESEPGLYFCGLHFQYAASSDSVMGMQRDARWIMRHLLRHRPATTSASELSDALA